MTRVCALVIGLLTFAVSTGPAAAQPLSVALENVAARLGQFPALKAKKLAVGDFPLTDGRPTELGVHVAAELGVALTGKSVAVGYEVVARSKLCEVIRENKLWVNDQFDPALHKKLGRLTQADVLATGSITELGREMRVFVRFIDTETSREVWASAVTVALDEALKTLLSRRRVGDGCGEPASPTVATDTPPARPDAPPVRPGTPPASADPERLSVKVWADRPSYRIGETVRFGLRVNRDAYVTLINIGTSGDVTVIYPNRFHPSHFVRAGQDVTIPPPDAGFTLTVQGPPGFDQVRAVATMEPVAIHRGNFAAQGATFRSLDRVQTRGLSVEIREERQKTDPSKWAEEVVVVEVGR